MQKEVVVRDRLPVSPENLFKAFTDPEILRRWYRPDNLTISELEAEPKVGGKFRVVMTAPAGNKHIAFGAYMEVVPAKRLVFSWSWEGRKWEEDSVVTVEFFPSSLGTDIILTHKGIPQSEVEAHEFGWASCIGKLREVI